MKEIFCNRLLIALGVCCALVITGLLSLYAFLPLYLVKELGADLSYGGYAIAFLNGVSIPVVPVVGSLSDRYGRKTVIFALSVGSAIVLYVFPLLTGAIHVVAGIAAMGVIVGTAFSIFLSYVVDSAPSSRRSLALGYFNTITALGGAVGTIGAGYVSDIFGVKYVFAFVAALSALAALLVFVIAEPRSAAVAEHRPR